MNDQRSLSEQMMDVYTYALDCGMYDAADWITHAFFGYVEYSEPGEVL